jgi:hypothetical protein
MYFRVTQVRQSRQSAPARPSVLGLVFCMLGLGGKNVNHPACEVGRCVVSKQSTAGTCRQGLELHSGCSGLHQNTELKVLGFQFCSSSPRLGHLWSLMSK